MPISGPIHSLWRESSCPLVLALALALQLFQCLPGLVIRLSVRLCCETIISSLLSLKKQTESLSILGIISII